MAVGGKWRDGITSVLALESQNEFSLTNALYISSVRIANGEELSKLFMTFSSFMSPAAVAIVSPPTRPLILSVAPRRRAMLRWSASMPMGGMRPVAAGGRGVQEFMEAAREMTRRPDGGPPRWFSPYERGCAGARQRVPGAPTLLYLPGIDGVGLGLIRHHETLEKIFSVWCLHIPVEDRTPFERLVEYVERTVKSEISRAPGRPVYLLGESVGACIALAVAVQNRDIDLVLILINPGTSYHKSQLQSLSALLDIVPDASHLRTPWFLNFLAGNIMKIPSTFIGRGVSLEEGGQALSEITTKLRLSLQLLVDILPRETIVWKLKMLRTASSFVNSRLHAVKAQTLVLASGRDELLPSREEAQRLQGMLENCRIRYFTDNSHTILMEEGFDIVTTIKGAGYYRRSRQADFVLDYLPPTPDELKKGTDIIRIFNFATDPVILSTLPDGKIVRGLEGLPKEGPTVLVGYHMLMALESATLVHGVLRSTGINFRGLVHPFLFDKNSEQLMPDPSLFDVYRIFGVAPATSVNFYKLLSEKHFVLLNPGGAREALHRKGEEYKLFWPEKPEFVRMASRFGATIIPFGVVGEDDICDIVLDYNDLRKLPFYDILDKELNTYSMKLREDSPGELKDQAIHPIVVSPKVPGRFYFIFGKPIETRGRKKELRDKENARQLYLHVKSEAEKYIKYLKEKREEDPYRSILTRILYQVVNGRNAEIPTFEP